MELKFNKIPTGEVIPRFFGILFLALVLLNSCWIGAAFASESMHVSGETSVDDECVTPVFLGKNLFVGLMTDLISTGNFEGKVSRTGTFVAHPNGLGTLQSFGTFCGTLYDEDGNCRGRGTMAQDGFIRVDGASISGSFVGHNGTGGFRGAHLVGSINGEGFTATYEGEIHFDPAVDPECDSPVPECDDLC